MPSMLWRALRAALAKSRIRDAPRESQARILSSAKDCPGEGT